MAKRGPQRKNWLFTGWEEKGCPTVAEVWAEFGDEGKTPMLDYICGQREKAPSTGMMHIQGWCQFKKKQFLTGVVKALPSKLFHLESCRGTEEQNKKYCSKPETSEGKFEEFGNYSQQGKARVLKDIADDMAAGTSYKKLWAKYPQMMIRHFAGVREGCKMLQECKMPPARKIEDFCLEWQDLKVTDWSKTQIFWGVSGTGKTEFARAHFNNPLVVRHLDQLALFDETEHDGIIFDDMNLIKHPRHAVIHLVDQDLPSAIHIRYGLAHIPMHTKKIFTTNDFEGWLFDPEMENREAIERRLNVTQLKTFQGRKAQALHATVVESDEKKADEPAKKKKKRRKRKRAPVAPTNHLNLTAGQKRVRLHYNTPSDSDPDTVENGRRGTITYV